MYSQEEKEPCRYATSLKILDRKDNNILFAKNCLLLIHRHREQTGDYQRGGVLGGLGKNWWKGEKIQVSSYKNSHGT